jgi:hypothetical protein
MSGSRVAKSSAQRVPRESDENQAADHPDELTGKQEPGTERGEDAPLNVVSKPHHWRLSDADRETQRRSLQVCVWIACAAQGSSEPRGTYVIATSSPSPLGHRAYSRSGTWARPDRSSARARSELAGARAWPDPEPGLAGQDTQKRTPSEERARGTTRACARRRWLRDSRRSSSVPVGSYSVARPVYRANLGRGAPVCGSVSTTEAGARIPEPASLSGTCATPRRAVS